jgi:aerobic-type carbon monoxide dehydrogenase small subunit (CoxS/CutS family)
MSDMRERERRGAVTRRTFFRTAGIAAAAGALFREVPALAQDAKAPAIRTQGPGPVTITLLVNGGKREVTVEPRKTLLDTLRGDIDLTGAKRVCDRGTCGACTVWLDGVPVYACSILAVEAEGRAITTVEGLGTPDKPHAVQKAFWREDAMQCGFCTPGLVMSTAWAVKTYGKDLTEEQVKAATAGNLCRCGTYPHVVRAALAAAKEKA